MHLQPIDWAIVAFSLLVCFVPALFFGKRAGKSTSEFFASGRSVPWWLAGLSMVATTFSSDTPNWVTEQVRKFGVAGNWQWWAFVLTGVATHFAVEGTAREAVDRGYRVVVLEDCCGMGSRHGAMLGQA